MRRFPPLLALLAATLLLMAVAFADGRPTVFYDSHSYDVMGRDLIETIRDYPESYQNKYLHGRQMGDWPVPTDKLVDPQVEDARSPFYGVLLHGTYLAGSIWILAAIQSLLAGWVIYLLWRTLAPRAPPWSYLVLVVGAVVGTSVSFYTTFAMPDIFAGIGGAAVVLILAQADRLKRRELAGLWLVCAYSLMVHKSHWGTALVMAFAGGLLTWIMGVPALSVARRVSSILLAAAVAWSALAVFGHVYKERTGYKLGHPPFIMARMLADGPGRDYMRHACARGAPYTLCKFQANVGSSTDLILWSDRKTLGVFNIASRPERVRLEAEEMAFVLGTLKHDPVGQTLASLKDWRDQILAFQVDDPLRNPAAFLRGRYWPTTIIPRLIPNFDACRPPGDCRPPFDYKILAGWHGVVLSASALFLAWRLSLSDVRGAVWRRLRRRGGEGEALDESAVRVATVVLLLTGLLLVNAAICGILSGPFARYQARLVWLLPVGAGLAACALPNRLGVLAPIGRRLWDWSHGRWERLRAQPVIGRLLPPLGGDFMRFCCVGLLGFVVDFSILSAVVGLGMNKIGGRLVSFSVAVVATWLANRLWTFTGRRRPGHSLLREFGGYLAVQSVGFAANFAAYSLVVLQVPIRDQQLSLFAGSVVGTVAGLVINYLGAKHFVFRRRVDAS